MQEYPFDCALIVHWLPFVDTIRITLGLELFHSTSGPAFSSDMDLEIPMYNVALVGLIFTLLTGTTVGIGFVVGVGVGFVGTAGADPLPETWTRHPCAIPI